MRVAELRPSRVARGSLARPSSRARSGRCFTRLGNLSPTLIGTSEGSYRQLMGKRATVILSEREKAGGKVVAAPMQLISDDTTASLR